MDFLNQVTASRNATCPSSDEFDVPIAGLFVLPEMMAAKQVTVLKDNSFNTKILSIDFVRRNQHLLTIRKKETTPHHS